MNLLEIYNMMSNGELTKDQAAKLFGKTPRNLSISMGRWGHRFPLMLSVMDKYRTNSISRSEAAVALSLSEREINALAKGWVGARDPSPTAIRNARIEVKWELLKTYTIDFIAGTSTLEDAAEACSVTTRQVRRRASELLMKHFEMPWKDLTKLTEPKRRRVAEAIEAAEGLEAAKQQVARAIATGKMTTEEAGVERLLTKRAKKATTHVR